MGDAGEYGVVSADVLKSVSGLEFLQGIINGRYPKPPMAATLNMELKEVEQGRAVFSGEPKPAFNNPIGTVHAGFAATLLDSCMACSVHSTLEKGQGYTTMEFKISLVRPVTENMGRVRAEGAVLSRGRRAATAEGRLTDAAGKLLAHATTTCLIFDL